MKCSHWCSWEWNSLNLAPSSMGLGSKLTQWSWLKKITFFIDHKGVKLIHGSTFATLLCNPCTLLFLKFSWTWSCKANYNVADLQDEWKWHDTVSLPATQNLKMWWTLTMIIWEAEVTMVHSDWSLKIVFPMKIAMEYWIIFKMSLVQ
jgi:hypothetical protein